MSDATYFHRLVSALGPNEYGLSDAEVARIEARHGFTFPPDLRALLQYCVPVAGQFPKWRGDPAELLKTMARPTDGLRFEVAHNGFWADVWGPRPADALDALAALDTRLRDAPKLIPVYGRRYLPALPCEAGNPVFALDGSRVGYAGFDLVAYFKHEFHVPFVEGNEVAPRPIAFWGDLATLSA
jgi:hypothetical protein